MNDNPEFIVIKFCLSLLSVLSLLTDFIFVIARTSDIIQIAAVSAGEEMNIYMTPTTEISIGASAATGLTYVGGVLKHKGQAVSCVNPQDGLSQFITFIKTFSNPILVGHNIQSFDLPVLINQLSRYNLYTDFQETVYGFIDTFKVAKRTWKKPKCGELQARNIGQNFPEPEIWCP